MKNLILVSLVLIILCSCKKETTPNDGSISTTVNSNFKMVQTNQNLQFWQEIYNDKNIGKYSDTMARCIKGGGIVFVGNSLFNNWNIEWNFRTYPAINRAFGGSRFTNIPPFLTDVITCYRPKQVVLYDGENEIIGGKNANEIFNDFKNVFEQTRKANPKARITVVSLKPSPSLWDKNYIVKAYNSYVRQYLRLKLNTSYIDVYSRMLTSYGKLRPELYKSDGLHMTGEGYIIWHETIEPYLMK